MTLGYLLELIRLQERTEGYGTQHSHPEVAQVLESSDLSSNPTSSLSVPI